MATQRKSGDVTAVMFSSPERGNAYLFWYDGRMEWIETVCSAIAPCFSTEAILESWFGNGSKRNSSVSNILRLSGKSMGTPSTSMCIRELDNGPKRQLFIEACLLLDIKLDAHSALSIVVDCHCRTYGL
jgi:hypothetical protein